MKQYILIEVDTEHTLMNFDTDLVEYVKDEIIAMGVIDIEGVAGVTVYSVEGLHHHTCLLMDMGD